MMSLLIARKIAKRVTQSTRRPRTELLAVYDGTHWGLKLSPPWAGEINGSPLFQNESKYMVNVDSVTSVGRAVEHRNILPPEAMGLVVIGFTIKAWPWDKLPDALLWSCLAVERVGLLKKNFYIEVTEAALYGELNQFFSDDSYKESLETLEHPDDPGFLAFASQRVDSDVI